MQGARLSFAERKLSKKVDEKDGSDTDYEIDGGVVPRNSIFGQRFRRDQSRPRLQKEGAGSDNLAVGWAKTGQIHIGAEVISRALLSPFQ